MNHSRMFLRQISFRLRIVKSNSYCEITKPTQYLGKKNPTKRVEVLEIFSSENWGNSKDYLNNCKGYLSNKKIRSTLAMIPIKSPVYIQKANKEKQPSRGDLMKRCSENMQQIYRRKALPKCDFNKVAKAT